ncbi:MAG: fumarate/nitrate reduction transcriptional regulator Fnr [Wenzhouxiangellaceae bacterium]
MKQLRERCSHCSLQELCLPAGIDDQDLEQLDHLVAERRRLERGQYLYLQGQPYTSLYVVRFGSFKSVANLEQGDEQVIGFHLSGELLGLDALGPGAHQCAAQALETSTVCEIPYEQLESVARAIPGLQRQLMSMISRELNQEQQHLVLITRKSARARLATFLLSYARRLEVRGFRGDEFTLSLSRYDLASFLGLAVETVSRLFTAFREEGLLRVERRRIGLLDRNALSREAERCE